MGYRFFWTASEEGRVKSMIEGLDKKSLVRGMHTKNVFVLHESNSTDAALEKYKSLLKGEWLPTKFASRDAFVAFQHLVSPIQ